ncbi:hypothetical protein ACHAWT_002513 [Skeletonema menzelii]
MTMSSFRHPLLIFTAAVGVLSASAHDNSKLDWLVGTWNLCNGRQSRLVNTVDSRLVGSNNNPQCSDYWKMHISSLDDDPDTFVNFKLEAPFDAPCELFGIPPSACENDSTWLNMTFVGTLSLNPRMQSSINFLGKRSAYKDAISGEWVPITTTLDGELTSLIVDVTNQKEIYVDWLASGRRWSYNEDEVGQQHDILSVRSWMMVKDLKYCDTCSTTATASKSSKKLT